MPLPPSASDSSAISNDLFEFDLPVVREDEAPTPSPRPSYELLQAHAHFLIESGLAANRQPNPEPFILN